MPEGHDLVAVTNEANRIRAPTHKEVTDPAGLKNSHPIFLRNRHRGHEYAL